MKREKRVMTTSVILLLLIMILFILYYLYKKWIISSLDYKNDFVVMNDVLSIDDIHFAQQCTENITDIDDTPCFTSFHRILFEKVKRKLGKQNMFVAHARFSNNNNNDGLVFHRDIKPHYRYGISTYPSIYTLVCYLDEAIIHIGPHSISVKPGDVVLFNAFCLHKAGDIHIWKNKNRRVLQWFHVCFDEEEKEHFYRQHSFMSSYTAPSWLKKLYYCFIDIKYLMEYHNLLLLLYPHCDSDFVTFRNEAYYCGSIDGVRYYREF